MQSGGQGWRVPACNPWFDVVHGVVGHGKNKHDEMIKKMADIDIDINNIYTNEDFDESYYDGWIITGSASSVVDNLDWMQKLKNKI